MFQKDISADDGSKTDQNKVKKTRKKRRVPGTDTPPRASIVLRLEVAALEAMKTRLTQFDGSRNDYICHLIDLDLERSKRFHS